jgi:hypothetical protein
MRAEETALTRESTSGHARRRGRVEAQAERRRALAPITRRSATDGAEGAGREDEGGAGEEAEARARASDDDDDSALPAPPHPRGVSDDGVRTEGGGLRPRAG